MFKGTVSFRSELEGKGLKFPRFEYKPTDPAAERVEIEGPNGDHILLVVHFASVASPEDARPVAARVANEALERISYHHGMAPGVARFTGHDFNPLNPAPGVLNFIGSGMPLFVGGAAPNHMSLQPAQLKPDLENPAPVGARHFPLFRAALLSGSPVESYMHLYNLFLMLFNDEQVDVDAFIIAQEPAVPQTQHPKKKPGKMETLYTRLRNEFAHVRAGVDMNQTKAEMEKHLGALRMLVQKAIGANP